MARTAVTRPAPSGAAPAAKLPARHTPWLRDAVLVGCVGLAAAGAATATGHTALALLAAITALAAAVITALWGARRAARRNLHDRLVESLSPLLGVRQLDRRVVTVSRWTHEWPGVPQRITVHYAPGAPDHDPAWLTQLLHTTRSRLLADYQIAQHHRRRCRIRLHLQPPTTTPAPPRALQRAEKAVTELIGPTAKVTGSELDGSELRSLTVTHDAAAKLAASGYRTRIERVLSTMLPGRWRAVWDLEGDSVRFEVRPHLPTSLWLPAKPLPDTDDLLRNYRKVEIGIAVDEDGREVVWRPAVTPMVMLTGSTGTGKTSAAHALLGQITRYGWPVWVLDAKRVEFLDFRDWPNVQIIAGTIPEQVALIHRAWQLMEHRYQLIESGQARVEDFEPLVVFLDEFADFRSNLLEWYARIKVKGDPAKPPALAEVASLARKARTARIHIVLSTQRPDAEFLGGEALAVDTPIPTPTGWTTMGELRAGDQVLDENGQPATVTACTPVLTSRPCYKVRFSDGTIITADANHLWAATESTQRWSVWSTMSRQQRWPAHAQLAQRMLSAEHLRGRHLTVPELEAATGGPRIALLRRTLATGRIQPRTYGTRKGARLYLADDLIDALLTEVHSPPRRWAKPNPQIVTTAHLAATARRRGAANWSVAVAQPLDLPDQPLPIDPWLLGYWLGDGDKNSASIATNDPEILARIQALGWSTPHYARFNYGVVGKTPSLREQLRDLGLLGDKHIPDTYLRASRTQREALLAGLLDSDGTSAVRSNPRTGRASGQVHFVNVNRRLAEQVAELVASLGFVPTVRSARPARVETNPRSVAYGSTCQQTWVVRFTPDRQVFTLTRKQAKLAPALDMPRRPTQTRRFIVSVEPVPSVPVRCITVDSPNHLFLATASFIPTHNCRDNFGFRVSMGRLSPQGAMMMWENPSIGVTLPRACVGRATATHDDGRPVEAQCYRFPSLHADPDTDEYQLLQQIRPPEAIHPRLLIVPPDADDEREPTYWEYAEADWVRAADRPDLDPLNAVAASGQTGRDQSSPLSVLGLSPVGRPEIPTSPSRPPQPTVDEADDDLNGSGDDAAGDDAYSDYGPPVGRDARDVQIGDLIEPEEGSGVWAVVDTEPEDDPTAPGLVMLSWRGDGDDLGTVSVPDDQYIQTRRPLEFEEVSG